MRKQNTMTKTEKCFPMNFCEISKNTFSYRTPPVAASKFYSFHGWKNFPEERFLKGEHHLTNFSTKIA